MKKGVEAGFVVATVLLAALVWGAFGGISLLTEGSGTPRSYGPMSASDANHDGEVTRAEMEAFVAKWPVRQVGMVAYFDQYDTNYDNTLMEKELKRVDPPYAFDSCDRNGDGVIAREEVEDYASERSYRQMSLLSFFDLIDTNANGVVSEAEMIAAQDAGQLPVGDT